MPTLYLFPTADEAASMPAATPHVRVGIIGVGMAQAAAQAARLIAVYKPRRVVLCGIAGACDKGTCLREVVQVVSDRVAGLPAKWDVEYLSSPVEGFRSAAALTVNHTGEALRLGTEGSLPLIEQMEGAAVAAVCRELGVAEYIHLRSISNYVDDPRSKWDIEGAVHSLREALATLNL